MAIAVQSPPKIAVAPIVMEVFPSMGDQQKLLANRLGYTPIAEYQGFQLEEDSILYFRLDSTTWLPILNMTIKDWSHKMKSTLFALDNQTIKIYINSREKALRDILMDFKIVKYDYDPKEDVIMIVGWPDVDGLYLEKSQSFPKQTSYQVISTLASSYKLGFATNIASTNDQMTWINPGDIAEEFIIKTVHRAYTNDDAMLWSFLDFYYCINFIDIEIEMRSDSSKQVGVVSFSGVETDVNNDVSQLILFFGNRVEGKSTNLDIADYEVYNQSTFQSLAHGYRKEVEYYDRSGNWNKGRAGQFLAFSLNTNQNPNSANDNIILKDKPNAKPEFFNNNTRFHWIGKFDINNVHVNYNYAIMHNRFNMEELQKVYLIVRMAVPNFNLKRFMKIKVVINDVPTVDSNFGLNERLSGAWLISGIAFEKSNGDFFQELVLVRRELTAKNFDV